MDKHHADIMHSDGMDGQVVVNLVEANEESWADVDMGGEQEHEHDHEMDGPDRTLAI